MSDDRCEFRTTKPKGAMSQSARYSRGSHRGLAYEQCRNRASGAILITETNLHTTTERLVLCCGLHKRLHETRGWLP